MDLFITMLLLQHIVAFLQQQANALNISQFNVPPYTYKSDDAILECRYDLGSDALYSVKWYRDNEEFYEYHTGITPKKNFTVAGINLNHQKSNSQKVILENVNLQTKGLYKCEVTGNKPNFRLVYEKAYMEVIVLPQSNPRITVMDHGEEKIYASGDVLTLNCTSDKSHPPARLTWYINGVEVKPDSEKSIKHGELESTVSTLSLELGSHHISAGRMNVRCEAIIKINNSDRPLDSRVTQVFVQGIASTMKPSIWLMAAFVMHRIAHHITPS